MPEQLCRSLAMGQLLRGGFGWAQTLDDLIFWSKIRIETRWDKSASHGKMVSFHAAWEVREAVNETIPVTLKMFIATMMAGIYPAGLRQFAPVESGSGQKRRQWGTSMLYHCLHLSHWQC